MLDIIETEEFKTKFESLIIWLTYKNVSLRDDLRSQAYVYLYELKNLQEEKNEELSQKLILWILKRRCLNYLFSKKMNFSYKEEKEHIYFGCSLEDYENFEQLVYEENLRTPSFESSLFARIEEEEILSILDYNYRRAFQLLDSGYSKRAIAKKLKISFKQLEQILKELLEIIRSFNGDNRENKDDSC
jgi:hypothetical protein